MGYVPYSPKIGDIYTLTSPTGRAVFNNPSDADYVGVLTSVVGLDSAEIRESAEELSSADGGTHGAFYYGRRPITLEGKLFDHSNAALRDARFDKLRRASNALRSDATLAWTPTGARQNIVTNPSFETNTNDWYIHTSMGGGWTMVRSTNWAFSGTQSLRVTGTASSPNDFLGVLAGNFAVTAGKTYTASARVNVVEAPSNGPGLWAEIFYFNASNVQLSQHNSLDIGSPAAYLTGQKWLEVTATAPPTATQAQIVFVMRTGAGAPGGVGDTMDFYTDAVLFEEAAGRNTFIEGGQAAIPMYTPVRRQQPLRLSGNWVKDFQLGLVSEFTPLFSVQLYSLSGSPVVCENHGDYPMLPIITVTGATPSTVVTNAANGKTLRFSASASGTVVVDLATRQATVGGVLSNQMLDFVNSTWPTVDMGNNSFSITGGGTLNVQWRDAWS